MLWVEGGWIGWSALTLNVAGFTLTGDLSWAILFGLFNKLHLSEAGFSGQLQTAVRVIPVPLILLIMSVFYLWVYARRCPAIGSLPA
jgi:hypothetical protein